MLRFIEPATRSLYFSTSRSLAEPQAEILGGWLLVCIAVSMTCLYQITGRRFGVIIWKVILDSVRGLGLLFHKRVLRYNEVISDVKWMRYMSSFPDHSPLLQNTHTHREVSANRNNPAPTPLAIQCLWRRLLRKQVQNLTKPYLGYTCLLGSLEDELGVRHEGWGRPVTQALGRWRQEELEFKINLSYQLSSRPAWALTGFCGCPVSVSIMQVFMSFDTEMCLVLRHTVEGPKVSGNAPVPNTLPTSLLQRWRLSDLV